MKSVVICGGAGFCGVHLTARLKAEGCTVRVVDRKPPEFGWIVPPDRFVEADLTKPFVANRVIGIAPVDEVYQLAAEVGGLGYIMDRDNDAEMLTNSMKINLAVVDACYRAKVGRVFFASSACVYPDAALADKRRSDGFSMRSCNERDAYPFDPNQAGGNEYATEKLFAERVYDAYARNYGMQVRIGRLHNYFGPYGTWQGGREKAPAAICRKVAELPPTGGVIEVWGDGTATRSFMYVDDAVEGIIRLTRSDFQGPVNIGSSELVTIAQLVWRVAAVAGKEVMIEYVKGPVGVQGRNSDNSLIREVLGWEPTIGLSKGLRLTYEWIAGQVDKARENVVQSAT